MTRYLIDIHCHTSEKSYDGKVPAAEIVRELAAHGFSGVVFTDHNHIWRKEELEALRAETGVGQEFFLHSGQEVRTSVGDLMGGDLLVYGIDEELPDGTEAREVLDKVRLGDAFCVAAHPPIPRIGFGRHLGDFPVGGCEVWNGRYGGRIVSGAEELARTYDLPRTGGSDTHKPGDIGGGATAFKEMPRDFEAFKRLILTHQCGPWKPSVKERFKKWLRSEGDE